MKNDLVERMEAVRGGVEEEAGGGGGGMQKWGGEVCGDSFIRRIEVISGEEMCRGVMLRDSEMKTVVVK